MGADRRTLRPRHAGRAPWGRSRKNPLARGRAGRGEKVDVKRRRGTRYEQRPDASLSSLLASGDIDAAISARVPGAFAAGGDKIARLFPPYRGDDRGHF